MSPDRVVVANLAFAQHALTNYARKLARSHREATAAQLAELQRLKAAVAEAKSRL